MRLDRYIAQCTGLPRSQAQRTIKQKRVALDGVICNKIAEQVRETTVVTLDGEVAAPHGDFYILLNKPAGYECTSGDSVHPPVFELLIQSLPEAHELHFAGRLDVDSTGLVLLTTDGAWSHRITSPRHKQTKTYLVGLADPLNPYAVGQLQKGVLLRGEEKPTQPAVVEKIDHQQIRITISEGRYHQVKRMLAAVGNKVESLHRERIAEIDLGDLEPGEWRELSEDEVQRMSKGLTSNAQNTTDSNDSDSHEEKTADQ